MTEMKKSINLLLVLFTVLAMLFTFTACDDDDDDSGDYSSYSSTRACTDDDEDIIYVITKAFEYADDYEDSESGLSYTEALTDSYTLSTTRNSTKYSVTVDEGSTYTAKLSSDYTTATVTYNISVTVNGDSYTLYLKWTETEDGDESLSLAVLNGVRLTGCSTDMIWLCSF